MNIPSGKLNSQLVMVLALVLSFLSVVMSASADGLGHWEIDFADRPHQFQNRTNRSLQVDGNGAPHMVYGQDHLYYTHYDDAAWQYEIVDESIRVGEYAALALDADNRPHISYYDRFNTDLKYATKEDGGWRVETIDREGVVGLFTSIDMDANGYPHISYHDQSNGWVKYAHQDASGWHIEKVDGQQYDQVYTSLALDAQGNPHISYRGSIEGRLKYAFKNQEGVWQTQTVDAGTWGYTAIAISSEGVIHISYTVYDGLKHAIWSENEWQFELVDAEGRGHNSLILDDDNHPHVSYTSDNDALQYARRDASGWHIEIVDQQGIGIGWHSAIALDNDGAIHIGYETWYPIRTLKYATNVSDDWQITSVDESLRVAGPPSLALDGSGHPHIGYRVASSSSGGAKLKFAYHDGTDWRSEVVDEARYIDYLSLAVDGLGNPHVVYTAYDVDPPWSGLRYAYRDGEDWHFETVSERPGQRLSLVLDGEDQPHISYIDAGDAQYIRRDGDVWRLETVLSLPQTNGFVSLAVDSQGRPHLAAASAVPFPDSERWSLTYAYRDAGGWHTETVGEFGGGAFPSLALDAQDRPAISYRGGGRNEEGDDYHLRYARRHDKVWRIELLNETDGGCTSLALDNDDRAHISYLAEGLKCIRQDDAGWSAVSMISQWGGCGSLALDHAGSSNIAFVNALTGDLELARFMPDLNPIWMPLMQR